MKNFVSLLVSKLYTDPKNYIFYLFNHILAATSEKEKK